MEGKVRLGLVGLGSIASKAYMPVLTRETDWTLTGCYARTPEKRAAFSAIHGVPAMDSLEALAEVADAVVVNTSTESHHEVAAFFLDRGIHVLIDKPLTATLKEAEDLVFRSVHHQALLMVSFNRRFVPLYQKVKEAVTPHALVRIVKNRDRRVGPQSADFTLQDDYIHLVDTARWLVQGKLILEDGDIHVNADNQLVYANHRFRSPDGVRVETLLHRNAGRTQETLEIITEGRTLRVRDLATLEVEAEDTLTITAPSQWATVEKTKGFEGVIQHFTRCVVLKEEPRSSGMEALATQRLIDSIIRSN